MSNHHLGTKRPIQACLRCRNRKIRCTREKPECRQCLQHGHRCFYEPESTSEEDTPQAPPSITGDESKVSLLEQRVQQLESTVSGLVRRLDGDQTSPGTSIAHDYAQIMPGCLQEENGTMRYLSSFHWNRLMSHDGSNAASTPAPNVHKDQSSWAFFAQIDREFSPSAFMPSIGLVNDLWGVFKDRVDIVLRIVHKPSFERKLSKYFSVWQSPLSPAVSASRKSAQDDTERCAFEALVFAVLHAAAYSASPADLDLLCQKYKDPTANGWSRTATNTDKTKRQMIDGFTYASQQCLMRSNILALPRLDSIAAFALVIFTRYNEADNDYGLYTCVGTLLRCARKLGLHIDPKTFDGDSPENSDAVSLDPVEREMRRRLWHEIFYLDIMISEPAGIDPEPLPGGQLWPTGISTKLPANMSDEDLDVARTDPADEHYGPISDMSLELIRVRVGLCLRYITASSNMCLSFERDSQRMEDAINDTRRELLKLYESADESNPLHFKVKFLAILTIHKLWLMHAHWASKSKPTTEWTDIRKRGLASAASLIEKYTLLQSSAEAEQAKWHTRRHSQLHATLHILDELCRTDPLKIDIEVAQACWRAWSIVKDHPPKHIMDCLQAAATDGRENGPSKEVMRVWGLVSRLKEQAATRWSPNIDAPPLNALAAPELDMPMGQLPPQYMDFSTLAETDGLDYYSLFQGLDASFSMDFLSNQSAMGFN